MDKNRDILDKDRTLLERMAMTEIFVVTVKHSPEQHWDVSYVGRDLAQATWDADQWRIQLKSKGKDHVRVKSILIDDDGRVLI
jgi:hypothetical protein